MVEIWEDEPVGRLLRVHDVLRGEDVALRALQLGEVGEGTLADFSRLFLNLTRLDHPCLARALDFGRTESALYYTRELAPRESVVEALGAPDEHTLVQCLAGLADGLAALHAGGHVHGLAAPEHLRVAVAEGRLGSVRVTDAGLHRLLPKRHLEARGGYLSPEVKAGAEVSPASDVYGLGASLLEALGGQEARALLARGQAKPFRTAVRGFDRHLLDLLDLIVSPDPRHRPSSGLEVLRLMRDPGWALPARTPAVELLLSPLLIGRDQARAELEEVLLRRAASGESPSAVEVVGAPGMGRSRLLAEVGARARGEGWAVVRVEPPAGVDGLQELAVAVRLALGSGGESETSAGTEESPGPSEAGGTPLPLPENGSETPRYARLTEAICAAQDQASARLLLLADNADRLPSDLVAALRYVVTEAGHRALLVVASGERAVGLPDAGTVEIGPLTERDLRRLLAPLLTEILNPEPFVAAILAASGGNPLWVRLLLASWLESGRLRFTRGRPFFDEQAPAAIPSSIGAAVAALVERLHPLQRDLVAAMAVWGRPLPGRLAAELVPGRVVSPEALVTADETGTLRFVFDTFGPSILEALPAERRGRWHAAILAVLERQGVEPGVRGIHLLGAGRSAEAVHDLIAGARRCAAAFALRTAFEQYRLALANLSTLRPGEGDRNALALEAVQHAIRVGELTWALDVLRGIELPAAQVDPRFRFEVLLARARVLRDRKLTEEAARAFSEARTLAQQVPALQAEALRVELEESKNDFHKGDWQTGEQRLRPVVARLGVEGPPTLLATALIRLATLRNLAGDLQEAALLSLRAARLALHLGDHLLAAMAFTDLGSYYQLLGRPSRALQALDRCRRQLEACPHDGMAGSELVHRAEVLLGLGRLEEAERALLHARAIRLRAGAHERLPVVLVQLGKLRKRAGRLQEAAACYDEAVVIAERLDLREAHVARASLGELFLRQAEFHEAERFIRQGLQDPHLGRRGLGLKNLGALLRRQGKLREALAVLAECETALGPSLPNQRPLAVIEAARVHLDAGDADGAELRLAAVAQAAESPHPEVRSEYQLARGLLLARRGEEPYQAFDQALQTARQFGDLTLLAETLSDSLAATLARSSPDPKWTGERLGELEDVSSRMDIPHATLKLRALRGEVCARFPTLSPGEQLAHDFTAKMLNREEGSLDVVLRQTIRDLEGATGAVVLVAGLAPDGTLSLASLPGAPEDVRPYRVVAREFDRKVLRQALAAAEGNVPRAARLLRLPLSTFRYRAEKLGLVGRGARGSS